jgi:hypothetical protein
VADLVSFGPRRQNHVLFRKTTTYHVVVESEVPVWPCIVPYFVVSNHPTPELVAPNHVVLN